MPKRPARAASAALMLDTPDAAARLGVQPKTLEEWRRLKRSPIPHYKVRNAVRYKVSDIDTYLEKQRVGGA